MKTKKRVVVIQPDLDELSRLILILKSFEEFNVIQVYSLYEEALKNLLKDRPELILCEFNLYGKTSSIEGNKFLKSKNSKIDIILYSDFPEREKLFEGFKSGACGFILKKDSIINQVRLLENYLEGGAPVSSDIAKILIENYHHNPNTPLSDREREVLGLVAEGMSYTEIADTLFISKLTSKTHIRNIYTKLNVSNKSEAIKIAKSNSFI